MILTIEGLKDAGPSGERISEVAICFDQEGLDVLWRELERLKQKRGHSHLMTPAWAGNELTEEVQGGEKYVLINHLRLVRI